ncbi:MAG: GNAT family N-acetyltransferase, partial [Boseongicola sp.]|nr:GNAT family N-acetyltransferase [Boseongicola sp.]
MKPNELAEIHRQAMTVPVAWPAVTFEGFLAAPNAILAHHNTGFALGRVIADEAELLTIAVVPGEQGKGVGRICLSEFEIQAQKLGAKCAFLEVASTNAAALNLYKSADWTEIGVRKRYYT